MIQNIKFLSFGRYKFFHLCKIRVVVVLHAVCGQGGRVDCDTEAVLHVERVRACAVKGDGE